ncbi:hypothetical protein GALL_516790 [mine drainage metagenome]|uniref:Uncharacterized protein n=1 Tax=mine drainage metagenome TaxID=410659 RepID=A0A1J5PGQ1_9ZZZZ
MDHEGVLSHPRMDPGAVLARCDHDATLGVIERPRHQEASVGDALLYPLLVFGHPLACLGSVRPESQKDDEHGRAAVGHWGVFGRCRLAAARVGASEASQASIRSTSCRMNASS